MNNSSDPTTVKTEAELRKFIPNYPKILDRRLLPELDHYCLEFLRASQLAVCGHQNFLQTMEIFCVQDIEVVDKLTLRIPAEQATPAIKTGDQQNHASLYFLAPGVGHGLRVNGTVTRHKDQRLLKIRTAYLHCARAASRGKLWDSQSTDPLPKIATPEEFLALSPYTLLKTQDETGATQLSPRGDPAGFIEMRQQQLFIPERPGNKVAVSLRNILSQPKVELLSLIPGSSQRMRITGNASITHRADLLGRSAIHGKRPKLGVLLTDCHFEIDESKVLSRVDPWAKSNHADANGLTKFPKALNAHMNGEGWQGKLTSPIVDAVVKKDMKNLY